MSYFDELKAGCPDEWQAYVTHPFVQGIGDGTLPQEKFKHYLIQDYLFLIHFARAYALAVYKADNLADMRAAAATVQGLLDVEMSLHVQYCADWGISEAEMLATPEAAPNMAYTRFVLEAGMAGDALDLAVALAPCVIGYGEIGERLAADPATLRENNPYADWIAMYSGEDYQAVTQGTLENLEKLARARLTETRAQQMKNTFRQATKLEVGFWDMGWSLIT